MIAHIDRVLRDSPFAWWEWDFSKDTLKLNDLKAKMLGYDPREFQGKGYRAFTELLHPDDYEKTMSAMKRLLSGEQELYQIDYRILSSSGEYHFYMDRGYAISRDSNGQVKVVRGIVIDLGKESQKSGNMEAIIQILEKSMEGFLKEKASFLVLCSNCKRVKRSDLEWTEVSQDLVNLIGQKISHSICPECIKKLYPDLYQKVMGKVFEKK